jgi:hypothetical protein
MAMRTGRITIAHTIAAAKRNTTDRVPGTIITRIAPGATADQGATAVDSTVVALEPIPHPRRAVVVAEVEAVEINFKINTSFLWQKKISGLS